MKTSGTRGGQGLEWENSNTKGVKGCGGVWLLNRKISSVWSLVLSSDQSVTSVMLKFKCPPWKTGRMMTINDESSSRAVLTSLASLCTSQRTSLTLQSTICIFGVRWSINFYWLHVLVVPRLALLQLSHMQSWCNSFGGQVAWCDLCNRPVWTLIQRICQKWSCRCFCTF